MKIAINGDIIDFVFIKELDIENFTPFIFILLNLSNFINVFSIEVAIAYTQFDYSTMKASTQEEANSILIEHKNVTVKKIEDFRQSIIDIWSDNQSDIPQFNL